MEQTLTQIAVKIQLFFILLGLLNEAYNYFAIEPGEIDIVYDFHIYI